MGRVADRNEWNPSQDQTMSDHREHISTNDARAGSTPHMTRYILAFGLLLVIAAFIAIVLLWK
jgi:Flp pilus assembly protein TadB